MAQPVRTSCPFCSLGCAVLLRPPEGAVYRGDVAVAGLDYAGPLCARGNMTLELIEEPRRFETASTRGDDGPRPLALDKGIDLLLGGLERVRRRAGGRAIGLLAGSLLTDEEARLLVRWAQALDCPNVDLAEPHDRLLLRGLRRGPGAPDPVRGPEDLEDRTATLLVGDPFTLSPCIARPLLEARYDRPRNRQGVLGSTFSRTDWFAKPRLRCRPGREGAALLLLLDLALERAAPGDAPAWAASARATLERIGRPELERDSGLSADDAAPFLDALRNDERTAVVFACAFASTGRPDLAVATAAMLAEATGSAFLAVPEGANARGVERVLAEAGYPREKGHSAAEMIEAAATGDLDALVVFGGDPLEAHPGERARRAAGRLSLLATATPLPGATSEAAHLVLPTLLWGEKAGTVRDAYGRAVPLAVALPGPGAALSEHDLLESLLARSGSAPPGTPTTDPPAPDADAWLEEVEFAARLRRRGERRIEAGSHLLLPRPLAAHAADGWLTRGLSWPDREGPVAQGALSPADAHRLGVAAGDHVLVGGAETRARMAVRVDPRLPEGVVLAPPHFPGVRRLMRWRFDGALRDIDPRPGRVTVERDGEETP